MVVSSRIIPSGHGFLFTCTAVTARSVSIENTTRLHLSFSCVSRVPPRLVVFFFGTMWVWGQGAFDAGGRTGGLWDFGTFAASVAIVTVNARVALSTQSAQPPARVCKCKEQHRTMHAYAHVHVEEGDEEEAAQKESFGRLDMSRKCDACAAPPSRSNHQTVGTFSEADLWA